MNQRVIMAGSSAVLVAVMAVGALRVRYAVADRQFHIAKKVQGRDQVRFLERTLDLEPGMAPARLLLARDLMDLGRYDRALMHFNQLLHVADSAHLDKWELYERKGEALFHQGHAEEAIDAFHQAVALQPKASISHLYLSRAFQDLKQPDAAREELQAAIDSPQPEEEAYLELGSQLLKDGQDTGDLSHRMLAGGPRLAMDWHRLLAGDALSHQQPQKALQEMALASKANPTSNRPHLEAATILLRDDKTRQALEECQLAVKLEPTSEARLRMAGALEADKQWDTAVKVYEALAVDEPQEFARWVAQNRGPDPDNPAIIAWQERLETFINPGDVRLMGPGGEPGIQQAWYAGDEGKHQTNLKLSNSLFLQGALAQRRHDYTGAGQFYENALHFIPVAYSEQNTPFSNHLREGIEEGIDSVLQAQLSGEPATGPRQ